MFFSGESSEAVPENHHHDGYHRGDSDRDDTPDARARAAMEDPWGGLPTLHLYPSTLPATCAFHCSNGWVKSFFFFSFFFLETRCVKVRS